jgi:diguanylate cyclase (GGDEF)-like protein
MTLEAKEDSHEAPKISLILLDIDELTLITKRFGAEAGSMVLVEVLNLIANRSNGVHFGRCGDDTYFVVLTDSSTNQALKTANRLCKAIRRNNWSLISSELRVTASAGVVRLKRSEPAIDLVIRAAHGFKLAKAAGGNKAVLGPVLLEREESREIRHHFS